MADDHFCPICGNHCTEEAPVVDAEVVDDGPSEGELVAEVAEAALDAQEHAIDALVDVVHEQEETERAEVVGDVIETIAEEHSEEVIAEEAGDADEEGGEDEEPEALAEEPEEGEEAAAGEEEPDGETHQEPTPVEVPPQLHEENLREKPAGKKTAPAFRRRRMRGRR